jgi:hypothetical protein
VAFAFVVILGTLSVGIAAALRGLGFVRWSATALVAQLAVGLLVLLAPATARVSAYFAPFGYVEAVVAALLAAGCLLLLVLRLPRRR